MSSPVFSQYYLRGEIKNEQNQPLSYAKIFVHSIRAIYYSGANSGSFGISTHKLVDSITITLEDYQPLTLAVQANAWQHIVLKPLPTVSSKASQKLISISNDSKQENSDQTFSDDETYFKLVENDFTQADDRSNTSFSLNVNKASYSNVRRFLNMSSQVPPDAIRVEELVNYFNLNYQEPKAPSIFHVHPVLTNNPWNKEEQLLFINISAKKINLDKIPPCNFVFLIDVSASMELPNRLSLIKSAFQLFVKNLRPIDTVSIVTYGENVEVSLSATSGAQQERILTAIEKLEPYGETPGESGIKLAYQVANTQFIKNGNNRVILATDGDFNVGEKSEKGLDELITMERKTGIYLTCIGVGTGNLKDSKLQTLAKKGNGNYVYLDNQKEAERVFVKELTQTLYAVANNASMNIHFNPSLVKKYRLIGFDNKKEVLKTNEKTMEGGEVGSGSSVIAIFEIIPTEENNCIAFDQSGKEIAKLSLTYQSIEDSTWSKDNFSVPLRLYNIDSTEKAYQFLAAVTMFGLQLKQSKYFNEVNWSFIENFARKSADQNNFLQNEFLGLIAKAKKVYQYSEKRNKKKYLVF